MIRSSLDPVVYGAEFSVVFLAKGPRTTPILKRASVASAFVTYCERSELLIRQVYQFELGCIKKIAH